MRFKGLNGTLLLFSLAVTALLILAFMLFIKYLPAPQLSLPNYLASVNVEMFSSTLEQGQNVIPLQTVNGFISADQIEKIYLTAILQKLPYLLAFIVFFFAASAFALSKILQNQQEKQAQTLAKQLARIGDNGVFSGHPAVEKAYADIKTELLTNATDYMRLSSYVTHEQKNMLSLLRAKLQLSGRDDLLPDVDQVADSLDDILTLSASSKTLELEEIDAALICADVCDEYKKVCPGLEFDFDDTANTLIRSRELWISRALSNLIGNAVKYANAQGEIEVKIANQKGSVIITVSDEGGGIPEADLENLFDDRNRVGKLKKNGYGIGLSLVRHVCDLSSGLCWAQNGETGGTVFYMVFPEVLTTD